AFFRSLIYQARLGQVDRDQFLRREHLINIEQKLDAALRFADAEQVVCLDLHPERRHLFHILGRDLQHLRDFVNDDAYLDALRSDDDDTGFRGRLLGFHPELQPQLDHRNDFASQVDNAANEVRRARNARDWQQADDLLYLEDFDPVLFSGQ